MAEYIPPTADWVREQVELYEGSGGTEGTGTGEGGARDGIGALST